MPLLRLNFATSMSDISLDLQNIHDRKVRQNFLFSSAGDDKKVHEKR